MTEVTTNGRKRLTRRSGRKNSGRAATAELFARAEQRMMIEDKNQPKRAEAERYVA